MTNDTTSHLDLTLMVAFHDAFRRDLAHLAHATSRHRAQLDEPNRRTAVQAGWELFKTELHIHHTAEDADLWPRMRTHLADRPAELALLQAMQDEPSPEQVKAVLAGLPPPLRVVYRRIWQPRYGHHDHWELSTRA